MTIDEVLRENDRRVTRSRRAVWDTLTSGGGHLSAHEIAELVWRDVPGVNLSSVYRALTLFAALGLVRETRLSDEASKWEVTHEDRVIHLVCQRCESIQHHPTSLVQDLHAELAEASGFRAANVDVRVVGLCTACRSSEADEHVAPRTRRARRPG